MRPVPAVVHTVALHVLTYGYFTLANMDTPTDTWIRTQKGGHWQFLTVQALIAAMITFALSVLADFLPRSRAIVRAKRLTTMVALPTAVVVSGIYWSLILFAPSLILPPPPPTSFSSSPKASDSNSPLNLVWIPLHVDLTVHLLPALFLIADFYLLEEKYTKRDVNTYGPIMTLLFGGWYVGWVEWLALYNHRYPYPFLNVPTAPRSAIYIGAAVGGYLAFRGLNALHHGSPGLDEVAPEARKVIEPKRGDKTLK